MDRNDAQIEGHLDVATTAQLGGWLWNANDPTQRRTVEIKIDDETVGHFASSDFRQDLKDANIGDGFYSFSVELPADRFPPGVAVRVVDATTGQDLQNSPGHLAAADGIVARIAGETALDHPPSRARSALTAENPSPAPHRASAPANASLRGSTLVGEILWADCNAVCGWVADPADPDRAVEVTIWVDGRQSGHIVADQPGSVSTSTPVAGSHTFRYDFDSSHLVAEDMRVSVTVEDTGLTLRPPGGVIKNAVSGQLDRCDSQLVRGWALNWNDPSKKLVVEIYVNNRFIGETVADRFRDDLRLAGATDAHCGFLFKLPEPIEMKLSAEVFVSVYIARTGFELAHSPWFIGHAVHLIRPSPPNE